MIEKRFTYSSEKEGYCLDDEYFCEMEDTEEIVMLLNAQQETIKKLQLDKLRELLSDYFDVCNENVVLEKENKQLKKLIKKVLETTPIKHSLAIELKNSVRDLYG